MAGHGELLLRGSLLRTFLLIAMPEGTAAGIACGVRDLLANYPDRNATRRYAEGFGWDATTDGIRALFGNIHENRTRTTRFKGE